MRAGSKTFETYPRHLCNQYYAFLYLDFDEYNSRKEWTGLSPQPVLGYRIPDNRYWIFSL